MTTNYHIQRNQVTIMHALTVLLGEAFTLTSTLEGKKQITNALVAINQCTKEISEEIKHPNANQ